MSDKRYIQGRFPIRRRKKDYGEEMGGQDVTVVGSAPLRIIVGGPPHSGKSTLMHLLEDKFNEYSVPVELVDMDLSAPTDLRSKEGFTVTRAKRDWTDELADEAAQLFEKGEGEVVLGDSVGLISSVTEILSQPADVAILIASGNKGDDNEIYREVVQKWKGFYDMKEINLPLLVVVRSSLNPEEMSMFDPRDNYGVIVGLDRKAFEDGLINPQDACIEGIVFEIGQAFDLVFTSPMMPEHREVIAAKWPSVKDIDTWRPETAYNLPVEKREFLSRLEKEYFDSRRNPNFELFDEYEAEEYKGTTASGHMVEWDDGSIYIEFADPIRNWKTDSVNEGRGYTSVTGDWYGGGNESPDEFRLTVINPDADYADFTIDIDDVEYYGDVSQNKRNRWRVDGDYRGNAPDIFDDMSDELVEAIEEGVNWMVGDFADYNAETFNAYSSRFGKKNPNTRSKLVSRGRRSVQADPEYQQFRKYSFAGLGLLSLGFYLLARNSKSDNDSNNG